ncbi:hypothetical protein SK128_019664 [Halocaridina rubra]|uniref:Uncharacterized protein n=1 Tax=Halocaridina rubra TaxID=373956 RepID=A0AAN8XH38_HALRR
MTSSSRACHIKKSIPIHSIKTMKEFKDCHHIPPHSSSFEDLVDSTTGLKADTPGGSNGSALELTPPTGSASFTLHYSNIRGLNSNISSVEHHFDTIPPNFLLLSETQLFMHQLTHFKSLTITCILRSLLETPSI